MKTQIEDLTNVIHDIEKIKKKDWFRSYDITSDLILLDNDKIAVIYADTTGGNITITLPTLADNKDRTIWIKNIGNAANNLTVDGEGAETIEGAATLALNAQYDSCILKAGTSEWYRFDQ